MNRNIATTIRGVVLLSLAAGGLVWAQDKLSQTDAGPPNPVSDEIRQTLSEGFEVHLDGKMIAQFWMRKDVPLEGSSGELGVQFGTVKSSALLGVVRLAEPWRDYKNGQIPAGVYTMRYEVQPADGNHMGVSSYRDFLLLIPAGEDKQLNAEYSYDELTQLSSMATGTPHPATLALFPVWDEVTETRLVKNELDQWTVAWKSGDTVFGLVVQGHGEI